MEIGTGLEDKVEMANLQVKASMFKPLLDEMVGGVWEGVWGCEGLWEM